MPVEPDIKPLPIKRRRFTFIILVVLFVATLPFFYLYATGYRFNLGSETPLVSTGGLYIAAERTGAQIFIDGKLVRETRLFRQAFYAQDLDPTTHRVTVQKPGHHTWVKELPVFPYLVTEAQAFNMPLVPHVRVISKWRTATGSAVVGPDFSASSTNPVVVAAGKLGPPRYELNPEYDALMELFATSTPTTTKVESAQPTVTAVGSESVPTSTATATEEVATTTILSNGVKLYEQNGDVYAQWIGARGDMPYYYCAEPFPRYSTSTVTTYVPNQHTKVELEASSAGALADSAQTIPVSAECDLTIKMDRKSETVHRFDFFPGSSDLVVLLLDSGVYVEEIDNRAWQNMQPIFLGEGLDMRIENGQIYVYDKGLIYQIVLND
jgi:hypothetical protein